MLWRKDPCVARIISSTGHFTHASRKFLSSSRANAWVERWRETIGMTTAAPRRRRRRPMRATLRLSCRQSLLEKPRSGLNQGRNPSSSRILAPRLKRSSRCMRAVPMVFLPDAGSPGSQTAHACLKTYSSGDDGARSTTASYLMHMPKCKRWTG